MDTVRRFDDRAEDYVRYRPTYPAQAVQNILDGLGPPERLVAADVGAGTGISARLLAECGVRVVAVEPGAEMRQSAESHPNVTWVSGLAESTGLRSDAFGLVLCAQSFHWFQPASVLPEFARILQPHGRLAVMWNRRNNGDPFTAGYREAILQVAGETAAERMAFDPDVIARSDLFSRPERISCPQFQRLDLAGLIGRARSVSYVPKSGPACEELLRLLGALYEHHADAGGFVTMVYETEVYLSSKL